MKNPPLDDYVAWNAGSGTGAARRAC